MQEPERTEFVGNLQEFVEFGYCHYHEVIQHLNDLREEINENEHKENADTYHPHLEDLFKGLTILQSETKFCDVTIKVGSKEFQAHKNILAASSDYFKIMFTSEFQEAGRSEVTVEGESNIFEELLHYIYTGEFNNLTEENAVEVLSMACYLHITPHVIQECKRHIARLLERRCVSMQNAYAISLRPEPELADLVKVVKQYIAGNFVHVAKKPGFVEETSRSCLEKYLEQAAEYNDNTEIFKAVLKWLRHDWDHRKQYAYDMLKLMHLRRVSTCALKNFMEDGRTEQVPDCKKLLNESIQRQTAKQLISQYTAYSYQHSRTGMRQKALIREIKRLPSTSFTYLRHLRSGVQIMQSENDLCDVTIKVGFQEFSAHKNILAASSDHFKTIFSSDVHSSEFTVDGDSKVFETLLALIYTGEVKSLTPENIPLVMNTSCYLGLSKGCQHSITSHIPLALQETPTASKQPMEASAVETTLKKVMNGTTKESYEMFDKLLQDNTNNVETYEELLICIGDENMAGNYADAVWCENLGTWKSLRQACDRMLPIPSYISCVAVNRYHSALGSVHSFSGMLKRRKRFVMVNTGEFLYAIGGMEEGKFLPDVECCSIFKKTWKFVSGLAIPCRDPSAVFYKGKILVYGLKSDSLSKYALQIFTPGNPEGNTLGKWTIALNDQQHSRRTSGTLKHVLTVQNDKVYRITYENTEDTDEDGEFVKMACVTELLCNFDSEIPVVDIGSTEDQTHLYEVLQRRWYHCNVQVTGTFSICGELYANVLGCVYKLGIKESEMYMEHHLSEFKNLYLDDDDGNTALFNTRVSLLSRPGEV